MRAGSVSVVIPVYESPCLDELAVRVEAALASTGRDYEVLFVDDGSPSLDLWPRLEALVAGRERLRAIRLTRNFGQQAATLCGLRAARGDLVITMDDDLQHRPEDLPKFLALEGWDIVIGQFERKHHAIAKRAASRIKGWFDRLIVDKPPWLHLTSYRMLSRAVVDGLLQIRTPHPFLPALMFHVSRNVTGVAVSHEPRRAGKSGYTLIKSVRVFSDLLINNSAIVLRSVGHVGIAIALASTLLGGVVVYRRLAHDTVVQGWASLMVAVLLLGGLLLFGLGVIGEYLVRIIEASEAKPTYFVRCAAEPATATARTAPSATDSAASRSSKEGETR